MAIAARWVAFHVEERLVVLARGASWMVKALSLSANLHVPRCSTLAALWNATLALYT